MRDAWTDKAVDLGTWIGSKRAFAELVGRRRIRATDRRLAPLCSGPDALLNARRAPATHRVR
jgi:hypothetical protein